MKNLAQVIEAILFSSGNGITRDEILSKLEGVTEFEFEDALKVLKEKYGGDSGIRIIFYNDKIQLQSNAAYGETVVEVLTPIRERELSKTLIEVLAIIAYKQPITRLEIEDIRGLSSEYACAMLEKSNLIFESGRKEAVGRPILYSTTDEFLKRFSLSSLENLPDKDALEEKLAEIESNYNKMTSSLYRDVGKEEEECTVHSAQCTVEEEAKEEKTLDEALEELPDFLADEEFVDVIESD
jgi:segregation and condensation protein B